MIKPRIRRVIKALRAYREQEKLKRRDQHVPAVKVKATDKIGECTATISILAPLPQLQESWLRTLRQFNKSDLSRQTAQELLIHELPDPENDLFVQVDKKLTLKTFTLFPELPQELRLKIWRLAIPARQKVIDLAFRDLHTIAPLHGFGCTCRMTSLAPRDILYVNRESRQEFLRHFDLVHRSDYLRQKVPEIPESEWSEHGLTSYPALLDRHNHSARIYIHICAHDVWPDFPLTSSAEWLEFVHANGGSTVLKNIKVLELRPIMWLNREYGTAREDQATYVFYLILRKFPALEKFVVTMEYRCPYHPPSVIPYPDLAEDCKRIMELAWKRAIQRGEIVSGKAPDVEIKKWYPAFVQFHRL